MNLVLPNLTHQIIDEVNTGLSDHNKNLLLKLEWTYFITFETTLRDVIDKLKYGDQSSIDTYNAEFSKYWDKTNNDYFKNFLISHKKYIDIVKSDIEDAQAEVEDDKDKDRLHKLERIRQQIQIAYITLQEHLQTWNTAILPSVVVTNPNGSVVLGRSLGGGKTKSKYISTSNFVMKEINGLMRKRIIWVPNQEYVRIKENGVYVFKKV